MTIYGRSWQVTSQHDIIHWCSSRYRERLASSLGESSGRFFEWWWGGWATPCSEVQRKNQIRRSSRCQWGSCTSCTSSKSIHSIHSTTSATSSSCSSSSCSTSRSTAQFSVVYATSKHNSTSKCKLTTCQRSTRLGTKLPMGSRSQWSTPKVWCASIPTTATRGNQCMFSGKGCFRADAHRRRLEWPDDLNALLTVGVFVLFRCSVDMCLCESVR